MAVDRTTMATMSLPASALYGAILVIFTILLAANVSRHRNRAQALHGDAGDQDLHNAIRAHGNATEYVPLGLLILVIAEAMGAHASSMHGLGGTLLLARLAHAHGMLTSTRATRAAGALFTWLAIVGAAIYALMLRFG